MSNTDKKLVKKSVNIPSAVWAYYERKSERYGLDLAEVVRQALIRDMMHDENDRLRAEIAQYQDRADA